MALIISASLFIPLLAHAQEVSAEGMIEQSPQTTPEEKIRFADGALEEMRTSVKDVGKMLESAERDKDMVRIQCLGKKATTMRALLEVSEASAITLKQALASGEYESAEHEYRKIAIALAKIKQFRAEADACGGGPGAQPGSTQIEVIQDAITADEDETEVVEWLDSEIWSDPPPTSQFQ